MTAFALRGRRAAADALLEREYEQLKPEIVATVAAKLAASGVRLDAADLDAAYNQAWHALHTKLSEGEAVDNRRGLLVMIAHRRALDEHRALHPSRRADAGRLDELSGEADVDQRLDDETRLRQFISGLRERLDRRELQAAALCYVYEYSRPEAARLIGVAPKRMEKIMDAVSRKIAPVIGEIRAGEWCEEHHSLVKAYALGLLDEDGDRYALARDHLADCSSCRRSVLRLRGIAAVAPPVPLLLGAVALAGAGAGAAGTARSGGGHGGGPLSEPRAKVAAVAAAVVAAVALALLLALGGGGSDTPGRRAATAPSAAARQQAAADARARARAAQRARARAEARAVARRRAAAARRRAAARRAAAAEAARRAAATATPPPAAMPAASPPAQTPPPAPPQPAAQPAPPPPPPAAEEQPPIRDGAEEFELR